MLELVSLVGDGRATNLDANAELTFDLAEIEQRQGGAAAKREPATWREYYGFLKALKLVDIAATGLRLTDVGQDLKADPTTAHLSAIFADHVRLFAETLALLLEESLTIDEVDDRVQSLYKQSWRTRASTRSRMDWQEVLGLIEGVGSRRWRATDAGRALLSNRMIVTPQAFESNLEDTVALPHAPAAIAESLDELRTATRTQDSRSTYNIWVPSPPSDPNKVENLRTIVNAAFSKIEREELFSFICQRFNLKRSSVESMLPFMRASGLLHEVGRGVYEATLAAQAWVDSGEDVNFVRILHANMRFIGEMVRFVQADVPRNSIYAEAKYYGLNRDKCRWIASFLLDTGLIEEPRYGSLRATSRGLALLAELPLADVPSQEQTVDHEDRPEHVAAVPTDTGRSSVGQEVVRFSREPLLGGQASGRGLEIAIRDLLVVLGFEARLIGGSGDADVVARWTNPDGSRSTAIVEAKARSAGTVTHNDISDVAIETHKSRHEASYVAIVGPGFSGDTIKNMAEQKSWALLDADRLASLAEASVALGLRPFQIAMMFRVPSGMNALEDLISTERRTLDILSFLIGKLVEEANESGEAISARDVSRDGRRTELSPSVEEVMISIETLSRLQVDVLRKVDAAGDPKFATYVLGDVTAGSAQLRALADAVDRGNVNRGR
ncbi:restriction endonuclease [Actinomycetospora soli]|uniref:restriction endonuclease n=1 Tax=Actinomycetospora soli TaxID=2893887 RepID=UPI001E50AF3F|nr:restriction endonuclease [Actinomycetospora soli]MCD2191607.1 restriction endonuclease [Actinomycetospora soli]